MFDDDDRCVWASDVTPNGAPFANVFGVRNGLSIDIVGLFLIGVRMLSFRLVYPNFPFTVLLVDFNFWAKLWGRRSPGDGVNDSVGILALLLE